jgi:hypothetical protein
VNKTVFHSPIEGRDVLVRTGTLAEGNSLIHSVFHSHSKDYVQMEKKGRNKLVNKLSSKLLESISAKKWESASKNVLVHVPYQETVSRIFSEFYASIFAPGTAIANLR